MDDEPLPTLPLEVYTHLIPNYTKEQREARKRQQDACEHHPQRWYSLTATDYILCLDCGKQFSTTR